MTTKTVEGVEAPRPVAVSEYVLAHRPGDGERPVRAATYCVPGRRVDSVENDSARPRGVESLPRSGRRSIVSTTATGPRGKPSAQESNKALDEVRFLLGKRRKVGFFGAKPLNRRQKKTGRQALVSVNAKSVSSQQRYMHAGDELQMPTYCICRRQVKKAIESRNELGGANYVSGAARRYRILYKHQHERALDIWRAS